MDFLLRLERRDGRPMISVAKKLVSWSAERCSTPNAEHDDVQKKNDPGVPQN